MEQRVTFGFLLLHLLCFPWALRMVDGSEACESIWGDTELRQAKLG